MEIHATFIAKRRIIKDFHERETTLIFSLKVATIKTPYSSFFIDEIQGATVRGTVLKKLIWNKERTSAEENTKFRPKQSEHTTTRNVAGSLLTSRTGLPRGSLIRHFCDFIVSFNRAKADEMIFRASNILVSTVLIAPASSTVFKYDPS